MDILFGSLFKKNVSTTSECCSTGTTEPSGTFAVDNGISIVDGKAGMGDNTVLMTRDVFLRGQENQINWDEEFASKDSYAASPDWSSYSEILQAVPNTGTGYRATIYVDAYSELSGGPNGPHSTDVFFGIDADAADANVNQLYFQTQHNNNASHTIVNGRAAIRSNILGKYFDLHNPEIASADLSLRFGYFADDTTPGVLDSDGVIYYNTTSDKLRAKEGGVWKDVISEGGSVAGLPISSSGQVIADVKDDFYLGKYLYLGDVDGTTGGGLIKIDLENDAVAIESTTVVNGLLNTFDFIVRNPATLLSITGSGGWTNYAAAGSGTLTNAPVAGNPTKWIRIMDDGVARYIPAW